MVGAKSEDDDEEGVQRDDPEDVLEEEERAIQAEKAFPGELFSCAIPFHRVPVVLFVSIGLGFLLIDRVDLRRFYWSLLKNQ